MWLYVQNSSSQEIGVHGSKVGFADQSLFSPDPSVVQQGRKISSRFLNNQAYLPEKNPSKLERLVAASCQDLRRTLFVLLWVDYVFLEFSVTSVSGMPNNTSYSIWVDFFFPLLLQCHTVLAKLGNLSSWLPIRNVYGNAHQVCLWLPRTCVTDIISCFYYKPIMSSINEKPSLKVISLTFKSFSKWSFANVLSIKGMFLWFTAIIKGIQKWLWNKIDKLACSERNVINSQSY